jgi:hypothetical protein
VLILNHRKLKKENQRKKAEESQDSHVPEITQSAKNIKRDIPVEQLLMKRQNETEAKLEEKRKEREMKEVSIF